MRKGSVLGSSPTRRTGPGTEQKPQETPTDHTRAQARARTRQEGKRATQSNRQAKRRLTFRRPVLGSVPFLLIARFWGRRSRFFDEDNQSSRLQKLPRARDHCRATGPRVYKSSWNPRPLQGNRPPCLQKFLQETSRVATGPQRWSRAFLLRSHSLAERAQRATL